jgi:hypothetical protein
MEHFAYYRADANQARKSPVNNGGAFWGGHHSTDFFKCQNTCNCDQFNSQMMMLLLLWVVVVYTYSLEMRTWVP